MFVYCTQVLRLSEGGAYNRIEVARASRRCPLLLEFLERGALSLTTARLVAPHLTPENHADLLAAASHKSRREVEEIVVRCSPKPDVRPSIREVPAARAPLPLAEPAHATAAPEATGMSAPAVVRRDVVPLSPDRYQVRFMASAETCKKLRRAQDLVRHAVPSGDPGQIVDRALDALLDVLVRKRLAQTTRPRRAGDPAADSRYIPASVRRAVSARDGGQCAFVAAGGRRCGERGFLEFHHVRPYARGGQATTNNIELRCRRHNAYEAERDVGSWQRNSSRDELVLARFGF